MELMVIFSVLMPLSTSALNFSDSEINPPEALTLPPASYGRSMPSDLEKVLQLIDDSSTENLGSRCVTNQNITVKVDIDTARYKGLTNMADTVAEIMSIHLNFTPEALLSVALQTLRPRLQYILEARWVALNASTGAPLSAVLLRPAKPRRPIHTSLAPAPLVTTVSEPKAMAQLARQPWFLGDRYAEYAPGQHMTRNPALMERGVWTHPYLCCERRRWLLSYTVRVPPHPNHTAKSVKEFISFDVDLSRLDINQCDVTEGSSDVTEMESDESSKQLNMFRGSHKCHETTTCSFTPGKGLVRGGYTCRCRPGFYAVGGQPVFDGTSVEVAYEERLQQGGGGTYDLLYVCKSCAVGCGNCTSDTPCMATYNWVFRIVLLTISMVCVLMTFIIIGLIVRYKRLKVIKAGSPIFLTVTLLGCVAMYMEMAAIFPVLDKFSCVATKWTRHMGFCITYSALLLKTWRVSLTYRVKSAHKLKLTDKQLLQWLFPILLIMIIYLSSWTVSDPPVAVLVEDAGGLQFRQCEYGWWDHSLAAGELLFLFWGIKVCVNVRNAQTLFDEAKYISWAIYNIAIVNIAMATVHVFITSGPDVKYLLGFVRTQLSTTTTIVLILAPKFYRIAVGQGDEYDARAQARGAAASFYLNGIEPDEEDISIYRENEELKEEVQKLAAQIEFMKIVHMEANNRHLKPRREGYFSQSLHGRRKSSMGAALKLEAYTSLPQDGVTQTGNEV